MAAKYYIKFYPMVRDEGVVFYYSGNPLHYCITLIWNGRFED